MVRATEGIEAMAAPILTHYNARMARANLRDVAREIVREGRPVVIAPRDEEPWVGVERTQLLELLAPYAPHVEITPNEETEGFTIWVEELRTLTGGKTFEEARDAAAREAFSDVDHFLQLWPRFKYTDRRKDWPFVLRLALAESVEEMGDLLFSRYASEPATTVLTQVPVYE
jgi:hypothetical protein